MEKAPKWYMPVAVVALLWNLMGCAAYLSDVMLTPEDIAKLSAAEQALYASRPTWSVAATAVAVWGGALGSLGLILRKGWATSLLIVSLAALVVQDASLFLMSGVGAVPMALVLQGVVLLVAIGLVLLARKAAASGWLR